MNSSTSSSPQSKPTCIVANRRTTPSPLSTMFDPRTAPHDRLNNSCISSANACSTKKRVASDDTDSSMQCPGFQIGKDGVHLDANFSLKIKSTRGTNNANEALMRVESGTRLIKYDELEKVGYFLGSGCQGTVGCCTLKNDSTKRFAIKKIALMDPDAGPEDAERRRHLAQLEVFRMFDHENDYIVKIHNAYLRQHGAYLYLLMEYMDWGDLDHVIKSRVESNALSEAPAAYIASQVLQALALLHDLHLIPTGPTTSGGNVNLNSNNNNDDTNISVAPPAAPKYGRYIHRDLKPENILFSRNGKVKLADFGFSSIVRSNRGTERVIGNRCYMSPERIRTHEYNTPSDIWSLGLIVAQMLLGHYPFQDLLANLASLSDTIEKLDALDLGIKYSPDANDFINRCIKQRPQDRSTAADLVNHHWIQRNAEAGRKELVSHLGSMLSSPFESLMMRDRSNSQMSDDGSSCSSTSFSASPSREMSVRGMSFTLE